VSQGCAGAPAIMDGVSSGPGAVVHRHGEMEMHCAASSVVRSIALLQQWLTSHSHSGLSELIAFSLVVK